MIRYLVLLYLGIISVVLIDPNPLWTVPLLIVLLGFMWDLKWLNLLGIIGFTVVTIGRLSGLYFTDLGELGMVSMAIVLPTVVLLEMSLSSRPYRIERVSLVPVTISLGMIGVFILGVYLLVRVQRIGVYLSSDPVLQILVLISLSIFLTSPVLLSSRQGNRNGNGEGGQQLGHETTMNK